MKICYLLYVTGFDTMSENDKKESETSGKEMMCTILYLENSDKARFGDLRKHIENGYLSNKEEYPRTINAVQSLLLNYQPNHNSN